MPGENACVLTTKDYSILEMMLERQPPDTALTQLLRSKIATARIVFGQDIDPAIVTLGSRISYRVDGQPAQIRVITHDQMHGLVGLLLPITNLRGLALLGLHEGQSCTITKSDGAEETLVVQSVVYQPEASRREAACLDEAKPARAAARPFLRLVHGSLADDPEPLPGALRTRQTVPVSNDGRDDPDPGPSAA